ncbi:hypothetical protein [uncultured Clostridium sp.]|uniref:hypothetical protein n=1 Tax=uncultured Clostridium sp. TaxID=59620 RepID=UPI0028ED282C|nr:hypothetical protein [uncultured Clostridium sp.]
MNILNEFKSLFRGTIRHLWRYGVIDDSEDIEEFVMDSTYIFIEMEKGYIKLKSVDGDSKIEVTIVDKIEYLVDLDEKICRGSINDFVFDYPVYDYYIKKLGGINVVIKQDKVICEALQLCVCINNTIVQDIFLETGFSGLLIGHISRKNKWVENFHLVEDESEIKETWFYED